MEGGADWIFQGQLKEDYLINFKKRKKKTKHTLMHINTPSQNHHAFFLIDG